MNEEEYKKKADMVLTLISESEDEFKRSNYRYLQIISDIRDRQGSGDHPLTVLMVISNLLYSAMDIQTSQDKKKIGIIVHALLDINLTPDEMKKVHEKAEEISNKLEGALDEKNKDDE